MKYLLNMLTFISVLIYAEERLLPLGNFGSVRYTYDDHNLLQIDRLSSSGNILYTHSYDWDLNGHLVSENLIGDLGVIEYEEDSIVRTPYNLEVCDYDENHNLISYFNDERLQEYAYNDKNELITKTTEVVCIYDENGNLIQKGDTLFDYDEAGHLTYVLSNKHLITYTYDCCGNRISRTVDGVKESYIYFDANEMAVLDSDGRVKELRIPGLSFHNDTLKPIAIETKEAIYAPIHDVQGNIIKLINITTKEVLSLTKSDPFGRGLSKDAPTSWIFAGKHYDKEADLIYFSNRYYCPELKQWMTPDPAHQTDDPYQYCLNNPFSYMDPDGRFAIPLVGLAWGGAITITAPVWAPYAAAAAAEALSGYGVYEGIQYFKASDIYQTTQEHWTKDQLLWEDGSNGKMEQAYHSEQTRKKAGELQKQVEKGQAPNSVDRVDKGRGPHEKDHVDFKDDHALNHDGTWKHKGRKIMNKEKEWLEDNGWMVP